MPALIAATDGDANSVANCCTIDTGEERAGERGGEVGRGGEKGTRRKASVLVQRCTAKTCLIEKRWNQGPESVLHARTCSMSEA